MLKTTESLVYESPFYIEFKYRSISRVISGKFHGKSANNCIPLAAMMGNERLPGSSTIVYTKKCPRDNCVLYST